MSGNPYNIVLDLIDHEEELRHCKSPPIFVNDFDLSDQDDQARFSNLIFTKYSDAVLSPIASCALGCTVGQSKIGTMCPECNTMVEIPVDREPEPIVWMKVPEGVDAFISPHVFNLIDQNTKFQSFSILQWLTDPYYKPRNIKQIAVKKFLSLEIPQGMNHFIRNWKTIFEYLIEEDILSTRNRKIYFLMELLNKTPETKLFSRYLPIPNRACLVVEELKAGPRAEQSTVDLINACGNIADVDRAVRPLSLALRESRVAKACRQLGEYYYDFIKTHLRPNAGWYRGNVYGTSMGYSARTVITSITEPHHWEEIHYPWAASVRLLSEHIANRLQLKGYPPNDIHDILMDAQNAVDCDRLTEAYYIVGEVIDELFELAMTIPGTDIKGFPFVDVRYPSLYRGSVQLLWITKVIRDPKIHASRMPMLTLSAYNADFNVMSHRTTSKSRGAILVENPIELLETANAA